MPRRREYLTPDQAAAFLGWVGKRRDERLLRVMFAKEQLLGKPIMLRNGGTKNGVRYKLTEQMLQRHCSELFLATQDDLVSDVKRHLNALDGRVRAIVDERTAPEFESLRATDQQFAHTIRRLTEHTNRLEIRISNIESPRESARVRTDRGSK